MRLFAALRAPGVGVPAADRLLLHSVVAVAQERGASGNLAVLAIGWRYDLSVGLAALDAGSLRRGRERHDDRPLLPSPRGERRAAQPGEEQGVEEEGEEEEEGEAGAGSRRRRLGERAHGSLRHFAPCPKVASMGLGFTELLVILAICLIVFGPGRLPDLGSGLGNALRNFRKAVNRPDAIDVTPRDDEQAGGQEGAGRKTRRGS